MFSVIIPTMWKFKPFLNFVADLSYHPLVGEIIIINNEPTSTPEHFALGLSKVRMFTFGRNIFVNPAWNFGVEQSKYDRLCILNDDLIFDLKLFNRLVPLITPDRGVHGICPGVKDTDQPLVTTGEIDIIRCDSPYHYRKHIGFGMLMFCHKANWVPIIDGLDVYWGDNFIYDVQYYAMNQNYQIANMFHYTPYAATCSTLDKPNEILSRENVVYNREMPRIFEKIRKENSYKTGF